MARSKPSDPDSDHVRLAEFRLEMGWTAYIAQKWLEREMPVIQRPRFRGDDYILSRHAVTRWVFAELERALDAPNVAAAGEGGALNLEAERARLTKEQADKAELDNAVTRKDLVSRARIEAGLAVMDLALKDRLMTVPMAAAPEAVDAATTGGVAAAAEVLAAHISSALADVASAKVVVRAGT